MILRKKITKDLIYLLVLACCSLFFFFFRLGSYGLLEPDEGRYSEIPREMVETGNFIVPHLNYVKYFEKPVLQYWMTAICFKVLGQNEFASRFVAAFFALLGVLVLYFLGRRMFGQAVGFLAGLLLVTSFEYFALSRILVLDMTLNFFISLSLALFYFGFTSHKRSGLYYHLSYVAMALGSLVKGPISLIFPLGIIFLFFILTNNFKAIKNIRLFSGLGLLLLVAGPWYFLVCLKDDKFFNFFFIHEHVLRFLTKTHGREGGFFYFFPILLVGFFPWIVYFPLSIVRYIRFKNYKENDSKIIFLLIWFFLIFTFFSISSSKLPAYIILVYFPLALLTAKLIYDYLKEDDQALGTLFQYGGYLLLLLIVGFSVGIYVAVIKDPDLSGAHYDSKKMIGYLLISFILLLITLLKRKRYYFIGVQFLMISSVLAQVIITLPKVESFRSVRQLGLIIKELKKTGDKIICYKDYLQSIPFYTGERTIIIGWKGELEFGFKNTSTEGFFFEQDQAIYDFLKGKQRIFCIASGDNWKIIKETHPGPLYKLGSVNRFTLFSNQE
ncbi:glycosyltransferase family 39 protein [Candidatus Auribacterota bacterium]